MSCCIDTTRGARSRTLGFRAGHKMAVTYNATSKILRQPLEGYWDLGPRTPIVVLVSSILTPRKNASLSLKRSSCNLCSSFLCTLFFIPMCFVLGLFCKVAALTMALSKQAYPTLCRPHCGISPICSIYPSDVTNTPPRVLKDNCRYILNLTDSPRGCQDTSPTNIRKLGWLFSQAAKPFSTGVECAP